MKLTVALSVLALLASPASAGINQVLNPPSAGNSLMNAQAEASRFEPLVDRIYTEHGQAAKSFSDALLGDAEFGFVSKSMPRFPGADLEGDLPDDFNFHASLEKARNCANGVEHAEGKYDEEACGPEPPSFKAVREAAAANPAFHTADAADGEPGEQPSHPDLLEKNRAIEAAQKQVIVQKAEAWGRHIQGIDSTDLGARAPTFCDKSWLEADIASSARFLQRLGLKIREDTPATAFQKRADKICTRFARIKMAEKMASLVAGPPTTPAPIGNTKGEGETEDLRLGRDGNQEGNQGTDTNGEQNRRRASGGDTSDPNPRDGTKETGTNPRTAEGTKETGTGFVETSAKSNDRGWMRSLRPPAKNRWPLAGVPGAARMTRLRTTGTNTIAQRHQMNLLPDGVFFQLTAGLSQFSGTYDLTLDFHNMIIHPACGLSVSVIEANWDPLDKIRATIGGAAGFTLRQDPHRRDPLISGYGGFGVGFAGTMTVPLPPPVSPLTGDVSLSLGLPWDGDKRPHPDFNPAKLITVALGVAIGTPALQAVSFDISMGHMTPAPLGFSADCTQWRYGTQNACMLAALAPWATSPVGAISAALYALQPSSHVEPTRWYHAGWGKYYGIFRHKDNNKYVHGYRCSRGGMSRRDFNAHCCPNYGRIC